MVEGWAKRYGLPQSLYVDRDSIYRCEGLGTLEEQIAGKTPQTQFGRAMEQLGVELLLANSPQAKGRVERENGVLQDRLVKALRLEEINDRDKANEFLRKVFLPAMNRKFEVQPASEADVHREPPRELKQILSWEVKRVVQRDWTVQHEGRWYQLDRRHETLALAGKSVIVRKLRDGTIQIEWQGQKLKWRKLSQRARRQEKAGVEMKLEPKPAIPGKEHPWRRPLLKGGRIAQFEMGDSGRTALRSVLPTSPISNPNAELQPQR